MTTWTPEDLLGLSRPSPLAVDWLAPVDVRLEGESVTWDRAATQARNGRQQVGPDLIEHFGALDRAQEFGTAVVNFVRAGFPPVQRRQHPAVLVDTERPEGAHEIR